MVLGRNVEAKNHPKHKARIIVICKYEYNK